MQTDRSLGITLHQLQIFTAVVKAGGFGPASDLLALSQPTVSDQMQSLERVLGVRLIERSPGRRRISVTPAGEVVMRMGVSVQGVLEAGMLELDELPTCDPRLAVTVSIGSGPNFTTKMLTPLVRIFCARYPHITIETAIEPRQRNLKRVRQGLRDFAMILGPIDDEQLVGESVASYDLALFGPPGHRLSGPERAPLAALARERLVAACPHSLAQRVLEQFAERAGITLQICRMETCFEDRLTAVEAGAGISANGLHVLRPHIADGRVSLLNVDEFPVPMDWYLVYRRGNLKPAARAFRDFLLAARHLIEDDTLWNTSSEVAVG